MAFRILVSILLLLAILFLPFYIYFSLIILGMIYFKVFYEALILLLISDVMFAVKDALFLDSYFISTIIGIILFTLIQYLKKKFKFDTEEMMLR